MRTDTKNLIKLHNVHIKAVDAAYIEPIEMLFLLSLMLWFFCCCCLILWRYC